MFVQLTEQHHGSEPTEHCVGGVHGDLVLGGISDQPLGVCEGHVAGRGPVALVICDDFHFAMLEHTNTGVGGPEVDTNCWSLRHGSYSEQRKNVNDTDSG